MDNDTRRAADSALDSTESAFTLVEGGGAAAARSKDDLMREFRVLIAEGEALLKATTNLSGEALKLARERFRASLSDARGRADQLSTVARERGRQAMAATDVYVHDNPWPAIGVAAGVGFALGALTLRRWR